MNLNGNFRKARELMKFLLFLSFILPVLSAAVAADQDIPWDKLKGSAGRYLNTCVSKQDQEAMSKKMNAQIQQRVEDNNISEDQAAGVALFEWAVDNQNKLKHLEPKAVAQLCFYTVRFLEKGYYISSSVRNALTPSVVDNFLKHLENEIKKRLASS